MKGRFARRIRRCSTRRRDSPCRTGHRMTATGRCRRRSRAPAPAPATSEGSLAGHWNLRRGRLSSRPGPARMLRQVACPLRELRPRAPAHSYTLCRMYTETFTQMRKQLGQLDKWLGTAAEHARSKNVDPDVLPALRLALDQFPLTRQVQICCDTVKLAASYLSGKAVESHPDTELTIEDLQARVRSTVCVPGQLHGRRFRRCRHRGCQPAALEGRMDDGIGLSRAARIAQLLLSPPPRRTPSSGTTASSSASVIFSERRPSGRQPDNGTSGLLIKQSLDRTSATTCTTDQRRSWRFPPWEVQRREILHRPACSQCVRTPP